MRVATRHSHDRLEDVISEAWIASGLRNYFRFLSRMNQVWPIWEKTLLGSRIDPDDSLNLSSRLRSEALEEDLAFLTEKIPKSKIPREDFSISSSAASNSTKARSVGLLYVMEGSRLGGQGILKSLAPLGITPIEGGRFLHGYGAETPRRWFELLEWADDRLGEEEFPEAQIAAVDAFTEILSLWDEK